MPPRDRFSTCRTGGGSKSSAGPASAERVTRLPRQSRSVKGIRVDSVMRKSPGDGTGRKCGDRARQEAASLGRGGSSHVALPMIFFLFHFPRKKKSHDRALPVVSWRG